MRYLPILLVLFTVSFAQIPAESILDWGASPETVNAVNAQDGSRRLDEFEGRDCLGQTQAATSVISYDGKLFQTTVTLI